jgi:hypothetical protein
LDLVWQRLTPEAAARAHRAGRAGRHTVGDGANGAAVRARRAVPVLTCDPFAAVCPLPDRRRIERALRPFRRPTPTPRGEPVLDDEATAVRAVQDGLRLPETSPAMERRLDLVLIVDDGPLAELTNPVTNEFVDCLGKSGAFRTLHTHSSILAQPGLTCRACGCQAGWPRRSRPPS